MSANALKFAFAAHAGQPRSPLVRLPDLSQPMRDAVAAFARRQLSVALPVTFASNWVERAGGGQTFSDRLRLAIISFARRQLAIAPMVNRISDDWFGGGKGPKFTQKQRSITRRRIEEARVRSFS